MSFEKVPTPSKVDPTLLFRVAREAIADARQGRQAQRQCPACDGIVEATGEDTQWFTRCPCGACNGVFKGL